jgi:hypothetical protein
MNMSCKVTIYDIEKTCIYIFVSTAISLNRGSSSGKSKFLTLNEVIYWIKVRKGQEDNTLFTLNFGWHQKIH